MWGTRVREREGFQTLTHPPEGSGACLVDLDVVGVDQLDRN